MWRSVHLEACVTSAPTKPDRPPRRFQPGGLVLDRHLAARGRRSRGLYSTTTCGLAITRPAPNPRRRPGPDPRSMPRTRTDRATPRWSPATDARGTRRRRSEMAARRGGRAQVPADRHTRPQCSCSGAALRRDAPGARRNTAVSCERTRRTRIFLLGLSGWSASIARPDCPWYRGPGRQCHRTPAHPYRVDDEGSRLPSSATRCDRPTPAARPAPRRTAASTQINSTRRAATTVRLSDLEAHAHLLVVPDVRRVAHRPDELTPPAGPPSGKTVS